MRKLWKRFVSLSRGQRVALAGMVGVLTFAGIMEDIGFGIGWIIGWIRG